MIRVREDVAWRDVVESTRFRSAASCPYGDVGEVDSEVACDLRGNSRVMSGTLSWASEPSVRASTGDGDRASTSVSCAGVDMSSSLVASEIWFKDRREGMPPTDLKKSSNSVPDMEKRMGGKAGAMNVATEVRSTGDDSSDSSKCETADTSGSASDLT